MTTWLSAAAVQGWQIDTVDTSGIGNYTSLRIDQKGNVHVAYVAEDGDHNTLRYAFWDSRLKRWFTMTVANGASFCSLTLDSKQRPHISYADYGTGSGAKLRHAYWDGATWTVTPIPLNSDIVAYYTSIALDPQDRPSMSFYEYRGRKGTDFAVRMRVVTWDGQLWELETVDGENQSGKFNSIAIDSQSRTHLAYANVGAQSAGIRYAVKNGDSWRAEVIEDLNKGSYFGYSAFLTLDKQDNPHIVYSNSSQRSVRYATHDGKQWILRTIDSVSGISYPDRHSIAIGDDGTAYISYYDLGAGALKLASGKGQEWVREVVDSGGVGFTSSSAVHGGQIWIAYADVVNKAMKVARRDLQPGVSSGTVRETAAPATAPLEAPRAAVPR
jgi:hypothetical protein